MSNRLAGEKSPYLLQHAENPVEWYPWGEEAFKKARLEDKPVFLSIGYSTCHWCHVMEHESFEDKEVAELLNRSFVAIKVDREERPDIDQVYMNACQAATGRGGWPLSIFMGPDKLPFYTGTYFPKRGRMGMPGLMEIAQRIAELWVAEREHLGRAGEQIVQAIQPRGGPQAMELPGRDLAETAAKGFSSSFDRVWGGFGPAPKFPSAHNLSFLVRRHWRDPGSDALPMVEKTLFSMRAGGMFDQVGFGFHRYSVDEKWLEPHFEKMLYDQAMLALACTDAFLATGDARHGKVSREIFEYVLRDMPGPEGGFYSAEDADSEGMEGAFYTWTPEQIAGILGKDAAEIFCRAFGVTSRGNFHGGTSILHIPAPFEKLAGDVGMGLPELEKTLEEGRKSLFEQREKRVHPLKDDKILAAWNGLMIAALARGAQALGEGLYASEAARAANFVLREMRNDSGRIYRRYRRGEVVNPGYADDYAFLIWGLIELYETLFDVRWLAEAVKLQEEMSRIFGAPDGGFHYSGHDAEQMIVNEKPLYDAALPSCNSVAAMNLLRLGRMTGNPEFEKQADLLMRSFAREVSSHPDACTQFLQALDFAHGPTREILIAGDLAASGTREMVECVHRAHSPNRVLLVKDSGAPGEELAKIAPFAGSIACDVVPAAYVCENFSCRNPARSVSELRAILEGRGEPVA